MRPRSRTEFLLQLLFRLGVRLLELVRQLLERLELFDVDPERFISG
jgi:hypothetical protein